MSRKYQLALELKCSLMSFERWVSGVRVLNLGEEEDNAQKERTFLLSNFVHFLLSFFNSFSKVEMYHLPGRISDRTCRMINGHVG